MEGFARRWSSQAKQDLDDSCGAASLATILSSFYRVEVSEQDIVEHLVESGVTGSSSFLDLANVAEHYDMHSAGYALSFDKMKELKIPAIVHLEYRENEEHFSVVRGIGDHTVWLGDPLWGNRHFSKQQFLSMWEGPSLTGYLLLIIPKEIDEETVDRDFFKQPAVSRLPLQLLTIGRHLTDIAVSSRH
ncbi:MAG: cysteine peptidase family C39 domain-containing protein [Spirochaetaceae bacterium]|nr:cysteine peptidase family C39 domain-containing protein [Spirochaetaceae bacterium]